jgi:hypothetical protein
LQLSPPACDSLAQPSPAGGATFAPTAKARPNLRLANSVRLEGGWGGRRLSLVGALESPAAGGDAWDWPALGLARRDRAAVAGQQRAPSIIACARRSARRGADSRAAPSPGRCGSLTFRGRPIPGMCRCRASARSTGCGLRATRPRAISAPRSTGPTFTGAGPRPGRCWARARRR